MNIRTIFGGMVAATFLLSLAYAQETPQFSGFLSDYSKLKPAGGDRMLDYVYADEANIEKLKSYDSIIIDQPEIFISEKSRYKGLKPDQITLIAETMRQHLVDTLSETYTVTDTPAGGVLFLRMALANMNIKKKKRGILSYTPVGAVVHAGVNVSKEVTEKTDLRGVTVEVELLDSVTGEQLAAAIDMRGRSYSADNPPPEDAPELTWELFNFMMQTYANRLNCRLENAQLEVEARQDCTKITLEELLAAQEDEGEG